MVRDDVHSWCALTVRAKREASASEGHLQLGLRLTIFSPAFPPSPSPKPRPTSRCNTPRA